MSVSVIIPAYNYAHFLPQTLDSVLRQDMCGVPLEIIVVDDGSTDTTRQCAEAYGTQIQYIYQENQGLSAARTAGMAYATGDALVFLDADDLLYAGVLASQWQCLSQNSLAHIALCKSYLVREGIDPGSLQVVGYHPLHQSSFAVHLCCGNVAPVHAFMVRRSLAIQVGDFDTRLRGCEDYDFWLRCVWAGGQVVANPQGVVIYRKHGEGMSSHSQSQAVYEAICNRRVAGALRDTTSVFLPDRRVDALMAHAVGSLKRVQMAAPYDANVAVALLEQCADALERVCDMCARFGVTPHTPFSLLGTALPRTMAEEYVLQFYIVRAFLSLRDVVNVGHERVAQAYTRLQGFFTGGDASDAALAERVEALLPTVHMPQDMEGIVDGDGYFKLEASLPCLHTVHP